MPEQQAPYKGSCLCGSIRFEVDAIDSQMGRCHCSMCRKFHGAEFATLGEASADEFRWTRGEDMLCSYVAPNGTTRRFCRNCGSSMTFEPSNNPDGLVEFSLGTLDCDIDVRPNAHIFVGSKANWSPIEDDLPQYVEGRDSQRNE